VGRDGALPAEERRRDLAGEEHDGRGGESILLQPRSSYGGAAGDGRAPVRVRYFQDSLSTMEPRYSVIPKGIHGHGTAFFDDFPQPDPGLARELLGRWTRFQKRYAAGEFDAYTLSWFADFPDPVELHKRLPGSGLVVERNAGNHGVVGGPNACVNQRVDAHFLEGVVEAGTSTCTARPAPKPRPWPGGPRSPLQPGAFLQ
jgi:hypothetical protein